MFGSGAGTSTAPTAVSVEAAGLMTQAAAQSLFASTAPLVFVIPTLASGLPAVYESRTEEKVRRMNAEIKNKDYPGLQWSHFNALHEVFMKTKTDLLKVLSIQNHEK